jgi:mutator protein MutT
MKRVRAVIIEGGKVLTIKRTKLGDIYWVMPGGGAEDGETDGQALVREIKEELGLDVKVGKIILEIDSKHPDLAGQKEYFYLCTILGGEIGTGRGPEFEKNTSYVGKFDIEWLDIKDLNHLDLRPKDIKDLIKEKVV